MRAKFVITSFIACLFLLKQAAGQEPKNEVHIYDQRGKAAGTSLRSEPRFEIRNGQLNIAVILSDNSVLQVTGVPVSALKDTVLSGKACRLVYMKSGVQGAFTSNEKDRNSVLTIRCAAAKTGSPLQVSMKGKVYRGNTFCSVDAHLWGKVPEQRYSTTQSH